MDLEKYILAVITTNKNKASAGSGVFLCESKEEMEKVTANLEAILDGIAHLLTDDLYVIVKH